MTDIEPGAAAPTPAKGCGPGCLRLVAGVVALSVAFGVSVWVKDKQASHVDRVTVSDVRKDDNDATYALVGKAAAFNDSEGGWVEVTARDVGWADNTTPLLSATINYEDGTTVDCKAFRDWIWGGETEPEDFDLECPYALDLTGISYISVTSDV